MKERTKRFLLLETSTYIDKNANKIVKNDKTIFEILISFDDLNLGIKVVITDNENIVKPTLVIVQPALSQV